MKGLVLSLFVLLCAGNGPAHAETAAGLIAKRSPYSVKQTLDRLENALRKRGITIALRWDHAARAKAAGIALRPTELLVFGNPKLGSHLFTARQTAGIDLPMKALAWQDEQGQVWLGYNDPQSIATRHAIANRDEILHQMRSALDKLTDIAIGK